MLQGEKECLYYALHHRLNGVVRDFVIEARAVAVGRAAEMLHLDRGVRWLTAAYEVGFAVDIGNDETKTAVYGKQRGAMEFEGGGVGRAAALFLGLATAFRLIEKLHRVNGGKHRHGGTADAVQIDALGKVSAVHPADSLNSGKYLCR